MKTIMLWALAIVATAPRASAQSGMASVVWPQRIAVGMRWGGTLPPLTVEASKNGWVTLSLLSTRPDVGVAPSPLRMMMEARDLRAWIKRVRPVLATLADTGRFPRTTFTLGNGAFQLDISTMTVRPDLRSPTLNWRACGASPGSASPSLSDIASLVELLDSAATIAGGGAGHPPTLARPYYSSEVSCAAVADETNQRPSAPAAMGTVATEVGARFVVDTTGLVDARSIRVIPSADRAVADSVRSAISRWRFRAAEIDGTPVRQIVQTSVLVEPRLIRLAPTARRFVDASTDGWVHLRRMNAGRVVAQEWFTPDSVDAFASRLDSLFREADALPKDTNIVRQKATSLGGPPGLSVTAGFFRHGKITDSTGSLTACVGGFGGPVVLPSAAELRAAAQAARAHRTPPTDPAIGYFASNDVACPASLLWTQSERYGPRSLWHYPIGVYPASMRGTNARTEVLAAFVVDTAGIVDLKSIEAIPGADTRIVAQLPGTLAAFRFRPAIRAGRPVPQLVIQTFAFEPPPFCQDSRANPACPHEYAPR